MFEILLAIALLDHDRFAVRQSAHDYLSARPEAGLWLHLAGRSTDVRHRVETIRRAHCSHRLRAILSGYRPVPWLDSLPGIEWTELSAHLPPGSYSDPPDWSGFRIGTISWVTSQLERMTDAQLHRTLRIMSARSAYYREHNCYPPEELPPPRAYRGD